MLAKYTIAPQATNELLGLTALVLPAACCLSPEAQVVSLGMIRIAFQQLTHLNFIKGFCPGTRGFN
jgi:hypothetical protein